MVDIQYLERLLILLKQNGVTSYRDGAFELKLMDEGHQTISPKVLPDAKDLSSVSLESELPPDLRADELMKQDNILMWSSPVDVQGEPIALTGDETL